MAKIYMIGDTHVGLGYPNKVDKWFKIHDDYFNKFLIPFLKESLEEGDIIIHLGDLFDNRNVIPINLLDFTQKIIEQIASIAPFHIIIGNHDLWTRSTSEINSVNLYKYIPNVFVYDSPKRIKFNELDLLMIPYIENKKEQVNIIKENSDCHYLFCHSDLSGARMHLNSVANKNNDKIDVDVFSNFIKVYSGHIHIVQSQKNFTFVGSVFEMDRNDIDNQKGIFVLDVDNKKEIFVENNISPRFKKMYLLKESDIDKLDGLVTKDYIDLFISNSLLINNRKFRRKIEILLEQGNFASIDYIDDINDSGDTEVNTEKVSEGISEEDKPKIDLNFKEVIIDYIKAQKYDNPKIKNGILNEYENIIRIYDEEYEKN